MPEGIDPLSERPVMPSKGFTSWVYGARSPFGNPEVVKELAALEGAVDPLPAELRFLELPGIERAKLPTTTATEAMLRRVSRAGHQWQAEIIGNSTLRFHYLSQKRAVARAYVDIPLQIGATMMGQANFVRELLQQEADPRVKQAAFIARPRAYLTPRGAEGFGYETVSQAMMRTLGSILSRGASSEEELERLAGRARKAINRGFENLAWSGARIVRHKYGDVTELVEQAKANVAAPMGSIYDVFQMGVVGVYSHPGLTANKLIDQLGQQGAYPITRAGELIPELATARVRDFRQKVSEIFRGSLLSDAAIKAEAALAGNMGMWKLGQLVPFGEYADPARQNYQRWAVLQLASAAGRKVAPVTTPEVEAAKEYITKVYGGSGQWGTEARMAIVLDPRFEQAIAASGGGAVTTRKLANQLAADVTAIAEASSGKWVNQLEQRGGRYVSAAGVGTPLITPIGKFTIAATIGRMMGFAGERRIPINMAVGWSYLMKGKDPAALREIILQNVISQVGPLREGYYRRGTLLPYSDIKVLKARKEAQESILREIQGIFKGTGISYQELYGKDALGQQVITGRMPSLRVGPEARFNLDELSQLTDAINRYNIFIKQKREEGTKTGLRPIQQAFERISLQFGGEKLDAFYLSSWVHRRAALQETATKAVGRWLTPVSEDYINPYGPAEARLKDTKSGKMLWRLHYHPRGVKLKMSEIANLELYHTEDARQLAQHYKGYIRRWKDFEKTELRKIIRPWIEQAEIPGKEKLLGKAKLPSGISLQDLAQKWRPASRLPMGAGLSMEELAGTILDPQSPFYRQGIAVNLPEAIQVGGFRAPIKGAQVEQQMVTSQIYLPALEFYRGLTGPGMATAKLGNAQQYVDKLVRAHESLYMAMAATSPKIGDIEEKAQRYYNLLGEALTGKTGILSYLNTARMAHSGYLALVPGGEGELAQRIGTALDPFTVQISEETARGLGLTAQDIEKMRRSGLYGRTVAYPSIGPSTENVYLFKLAKKGQLGRNQLRLSNYMALLMFRDFDRDMASVMFLADKESQQLAKTFYDRTMMPMLRQYHLGYKALSEMPSEVDAILSSLKGETKEAEVAAEQLKKEIRGALLGGQELTHQAMLKLAEFKGANIKNDLELAIARKYTTKALTGPINWYSSLIKDFLGTADIGNLAKGDMPSARLAASLMGLFEQNAAIAKGKKATVPEAAKAIVRTMAKAVTPGTPEFREAHETLATAFLQLGGVTEGGKPIGKLPEQITKEMQLQIKAAMGTGGEIMILMNKDQLLSGTEHLLRVRQLMLAEEKAGGGYRTTKDLLRKRADYSRAWHDVVQAFRLQAERAARAGTGGLKNLTEHGQAVLDMLGLMKPMGLEVDDAIAQIQTVMKLKEDPKVGAINRETKALAAESPGVLERSISWWHDAKTPMWQRAGVITGAAILLGAVAKNLLFPGYSPAPSTLPTQPFTPPPMLEPGSPITYPDFPTGGPPEIYRKPGGIFGRIGRTLGLGPEEYGAERRQGMPLARPLFGPKISPPGIGLDLGPGIAESPDRPMLLAGPPVGGSSPLPPAIPFAMGAPSEVAALPPSSEPIARMGAPSYMRRGWDVSGVEPAQVRRAELRDRLSSLTAADRMEMVSVNDPKDGRFERRLALEESEESSFS